jgi:hypothetical protein
LKIVFYLAHFSLRGTEVAVFDYARYAEEFLGHTPLIVCHGGHPSSVASVEARFRERFPVHLVSDFDEVQPFVEKANADLFYVLKAGERDGRVVSGIPNAVHAVFPTGKSDYHGERFAFISKWLARRCSGGAVPYVPHIISIPQPEGDLRSELNIPRDATVFGCYGGSSSFDIPFVRGIVRELAERPNGPYFLFMNIDRFVDAERAIFLPGSSDIGRKARFIATADAMLHGRHLGESFGIACGEFSVLNKPVITYAFSPQRNHIEVLGSRAMLYRGANDLRRLLSGFDRRAAAERDWDRYSKQFSPAPVMGRFSDVFIEGRRQTSALAPIRHVASQVESRLIAFRDRMNARSDVPIDGITP